MVKGLYTAYTGMRNEQRRMDILTNNLANSDTTGFKKEGVTSQSFDSLLAYRIKDSSTPGVDAAHIGSMNLGVKIGEVYTDYGQGPLKVTDNTFDMALTAEGFFTIDFTNKAGESYTLYTRDGNFNMTKEGYLVTQDGDFVVGTNGQHIQLSTTATETQPPQITMTQRKRRSTEADGSIRTVYCGGSCRSQILKTTTTWKSLVKICISRWKELRRGRPRRKSVRDIWRPLMCRRSTRWYR